MSPAGGPARAGLGWQTLGVAGEVVLTAGVLVLLYVGYLLVWTNVRADAAAAAAVEELRRSWGRPAAAPDRRGERAPRAAEPVRPLPGQPFAVLRIPRLGDDWVSPVLEGSGDGPGGITDADLDQGTVHYPGTALPGRRGNFAVAGHRATHGEPFRDLDRMERGDTVVVETAGQQLDYRVTNRRIVAPGDTDVLLPVPDRPGRRADRARLTLTTCHPSWASTFRLVVFAEMAGAGPAAGRGGGMYGAGQGRPHTERVPEPPTTRQPTEAVLDGGLVVALSGPVAVVRPKVGVTLALILEPRGDLGRFRDLDPSTEVPGLGRPGARSNLQAAPR